MSRILITGMSASQYSESSNIKTLMFAGTLSKAMQHAGCSVVQIEPSVKWTIDDLAQYDKVLVGISPLTSVSANHVYGALHVMNLLKGSDKLCLFVDAPEPSRILPSLRSVQKKPEGLIKPFFAYRKGYDFASEPANHAVMLAQVDDLLSVKWPTTLVPTLPWHTEDVFLQLPNAAQSSTVPLNVDSYLLTHLSIGEGKIKNARWAIDNFSTKWSTQTIGTIGRAVSPMSWNKGWTDSQVLNQLGGSLGALIASNYHGTWWTYRLLQALNVGTPVVTDWKESYIIGPSWMYLATQIEDMTPQERAVVSQEQYESYHHSVPSKTAVLSNIEALLQSTISMNLKEMVD